jgi:Flp pilus assembly pilin Flp
VVAAHLHHDRAMDTVLHFLGDDRGADLVEYALIVGVLSFAAVGVITALNGSIIDLATRIKNALDAALP